MPKANPAHIGNHVFATRAAATKHYQDILRQYAPKERLSDQDAREVADLLDCHPDASDKIGCGIDHFEVMFANCGTNCFRVVRTDGSGIDFSFVTCIAAAPADPPTFNTEAGLPLLLDAPR